MMEIKKAKDVLFRHVGHNLYFDLTDNQIGGISNAMKEYASQFIDSSYQSGYSDGRRKSGGWEVNQKESILKVKQLIK